MKNATDDPVLSNHPPVLGLFGAAHLGDTLCTSPLPRLLRQRLDRPIYVTDHPMTRAVFAGNPHVSGFAGRETIALNNRMIGSGHVLQRLAQGLELPVEPMPRPEICLTDAEREWAAGERRRWPADRPVCVLSTGAETDKANLERVDWAAVARVLCREFTVVQPVLAEPPIPGAVPYSQLPLRQYMALIAAADCFVGGTSGGSHVAAAFGVPSLIVAWRSLLDHLRFPVSGLGVVAAFCYPQHWFIAAEDLGRACFREESLLTRLREMSRCGRAGRPTHFGNYPSRPCGFIPAVPRPVTKVGSRLMRLPPVLNGEGRCA
jgi:hypothetical protein